MPPGFDELEQEARAEDAADEEQDHPDDFSLDYEGDYGEEDYEDWPEEDDTLIVWLIL